MSLLGHIYEDRLVDYHKLIEKYGKPRYRLAEFFVPFEMCAARLFHFDRDPKATWTPRATWSDKLGMEKPSKGWLAKCPVSDDTEDTDAYWGDKWTRKIGYFIWDRK